jgi:16S rRNA (cytosine967-C5)-methyltransferase
VFNSLPELQLEILAKAAGFVKSGGKLVYSTCSLLKEENEDVVSAFEHSHIFGRFQKWSFDTRENTIGYNTSHDNTLTILPSAMSDGFFIARWKAVK